MLKRTVLPEEAGQRLDHLLEHLLPDMGLRGRRRLCSSELVMVNGHPAREAFKPRAGDEITVTTAPSANPKHQWLPEITTSRYPAVKDTARVVLKAQHLALLYKPAAMHTERLAGKPGDCLEAHLTQLLEDSPSPQLLNRLDYFTSGIVSAALDEQGAASYHTAQERGLTQKLYLALLEGELTSPLLAAQFLSVKKRGHVRMEKNKNPDGRRHTTLTPLAILDAKPLLRRLGISEWSGTVPSCVTLAGCTILMGARHQIRAHAAGNGFPLLGDKLYGAALQMENGAFFLHHARLILPDITATILPSWLNHTGSTAAAHALDWLRNM